MSQHVIHRYCNLFGVFQVRPFPDSGRGLETYYGDREGDLENQALQLIRERFDYISMHKGDISTIFRFRVQTHRGAISQQFVTNVAGTKRGDFCTSSLARISARSRVEIEYSRAGTLQRNAGCRISPPTGMRADAL